jgi:hypothetical protein
MHQVDFPELRDGESLGRARRTQVHLSRDPWIDLHIIVFDAPIF